MLLAVKAIGRAGAGVNNIPLDKCAEKGIVVFNTPGANATGVKELVIAGMLLAARDVVGGINWVMNNTEDEAIAKTAEKEKKNFITRVSHPYVCKFICLCIRIDAFSTCNL